MSALTPPTTPHERVSRCKRSCCWTPLGHSSAAPSTCECHQGDDMANHVPAAQLLKLGARDGHTCVWTATDTDRIIPQHRQGGMGGSTRKHRLTNLLWLDSIINGLIVADAELQAVSKAFGIAIESYAAAEYVPVFHQHLQQWFVLEGDIRRPITAVEALDRMHETYGEKYFAWKAVAEHTARAGILHLRGGL